MAVSCLVILTLKQATNVVYSEPISIADIHFNLTNFIPTSTKTIQSTNDSNNSNITTIPSQPTQSPVTNITLQPPIDQIIICINCSNQVTKCNATTYSDLKCTINCIDLNSCINSNHCSLSGIEKFQIMFI